MPIFLGDGEAEKFEKLNSAALAFNVEEFDEVFIG